MRKLIGFLTVIILASVFLLGAAHHNPIPVTVTLDSSWQTICEIHYSGYYNNISFTVKNIGDTNPFTDCKVQVYIGPAEDDFLDYGVTWDACQSLAFGSSTMWEFFIISYRKVRVLAKSALGTDAYCNISANGP